MPCGVKTLVEASLGGRIFHHSFGNGLHTHNVRIQGFNCTIYGGSRGGAWAAIFAADVRLVWSRVLLVAPYVVPCRDAQPMAVGLQRLGERLQIRVGQADEWLPATYKFVEDCAISRTCDFQIFSGLAHEASLREREDLWTRAFSTR